MTGEHLSCKQADAGSSPAASTKTNLQRLRKVVMNKHHLDEKGLEAKVRRVREILVLDEENALWFLAAVESPAPPI